MDRKAIIDGLKMTMELCVFDPSTGEEIEPHLLNDMNRVTYDACKGALEILGRLDTDTDTISRQAAIDALNEVVKDHSITDFDAIASILDLPPAQPEPCEDAVSREKINKFCHEVIKRDPDGDNDIVKAFEALRAYVNSLPPVTPKQSTGKWIDGIIPNDSGGLPVIVCDQCNTFFPLQFGDGHNFCPNCGAKMEGKE